MGRPKKQPKKTFPEIYMEESGGPFDLPTEHTFPIFSGIVEPTITAVGPLTGLPDGAFEIRITNVSPWKVPESEEEKQKKKLAEIEKLKRKEDKAAKEEAEYWQKRDEQLANIKVDKSAPFLGLSEVMMMLKPRRG